MALYDIRPLQLHICKMLGEFDRVCREHNLTYYLWAGTMLGAVRHKGFIPWDDDMDIAMPREDYERLVEHRDEWLSGCLELAEWKHNPDYPGTFAKLQDPGTTLVERKSFAFVGGAYIDLFPLDGVPEGSIARRIHFFKFGFYKRLIYYVVRDPFKHGHGLSSLPYRLARRLFTMKGVLKNLDAVARKYTYSECDNVCDFDDGMSGILPKKVLGTPTPIQFEDMEAMGVEQWKVYLENKYGDYMTIPNVEHQRQHNFYLLDLNTPYRESLKRGI